MIGLGLTVSQALRANLCQELRLVGGTTDSIFPEVEALLQASADIQQALDYVAGRKNADRYESVVDFLFCELHTEYRSACFRFYLSRKEPLRDLITAAQRQVFAWELCQALALAYQVHCEKRRLGWEAFRQEVLLAVV
jgi:hypothetical protein